LPAVSDCKASVASAETPSEPGLGSLELGLHFKKSGEMGSEMAPNKPKPLSESPGCATSVLDALITTKQRWDV